MVATRRQPVINAFLVLFVLGGCANLPRGHEGTSIALIRSASGDWTVNYRLAAKTNRLGFARNPPVSRSLRWEPQDPTFEIVQADGKDLIQRRDRTPFVRVAFRLTPTYQHLGKDYAPFSSFSDGGILIHTGRYFACPDTCDSKDSTWQFSLTDELAQHILVDGDLHTDRATWTDSMDGTVVYVGDRVPVETEHAWIMIDSAFPSRVVDLLRENLPKMADHLSERFGELPRKPGFFASYDAEHPDSSGSQGGTLPDQIFMHFFGNSLERQLTEPDFDLWLSWFFAHETAHLYQSGADEGESWIHEGVADAFAAIILRSWSDRSRNYVVARREEALRECREGLQVRALESAAEAGEFQLYYVCGLILHLAIDEVIRRVDPAKDGLFSLWAAYEAEIAAGSKPDGATFRKIVANFAGIAVADWVEEFTTMPMPPLQVPESAPACFLLPIGR